MHHLLQQSVRDPRVGTAKILTAKVLSPCQALSKEARHRELFLECLLVLLKSCVLRNCQSNTWGSTSTWTAVGHTNSSTLASVSNV